MDTRRLLIVGGSIVGGFLALVLVGIGISALLGGDQSGQGGQDAATTTDPFGGGSGTRPIGPRGEGGSPFGDGSTSTRPGATAIAEASRPIGTIEKLHQPASAATAVLALDERREIVERALFVDRTSGHLYRRNLVMNETSQKFTNTTIPRVQQAVISPNGSSTVFNFLSPGRESVESFSGTLAAPPRADAQSPEESDPFMTLSGKFLPAGLEEVAFSPGSSKIAYLQLRPSGGTSIIVANPDGSSPTEIGALPFEDLVIQWPSPESIFVTTAASADAPGITYRFAPSGGSTTFLSGVPGLTVLGSPDGARILYSSTQSGVTALNVFTFAQREARRLPVETLAEKCVWSRQSPTVVYCAVPRTLPGAGYPDSWYRGEHAQEDIIWRIDVVSETTDIIAPRPEAPLAFDAVSLSLGPREEHLLFINRSDDTLYSVSLPLVPVSVGN